MPREVSLLYPIKKQCPFFILREHLVSKISFEKKVKKVRERATQVSLGQECLRQREEWGQSLAGTGARLLCSLTRTKAE